MAEFKYYLEKCYVLPLELKNDIIYCQRAMRDFLKVHGLVSDVFKEQADADPVQMRRILDELEDEVYEINAEHQFLLLRLNDDLGAFFRKLEENNIAISHQLANEFVSRQIVPLISDPSYQITPQSVHSRDSEEMLIRKHFLLSQDEEAGVPPLKLSDLDASIPLMLAPPVLGLGQQIAAVHPVQDHWTKIELAQPQPPATAPPPPAPPLQAQQDPQRSLLIARSEVPPEVPFKKKTVTCTSPPPLAPITNTVAPPHPTNPNPNPNPNSTPSPDFEVVAQSRMNLRQALKRARKTKQQPRLCEEDLELSSPDNTKKNNKASDGGKPPTPLEIAESLAGDTPTANPSPPAKKGAASQAAVASQLPPKTAYKTRNARRKSSPILQANSQPQPQSQTQSQSQPQPSNSPSASSDDSSAELQQELQRLCASAAQWRDEPRESRILPAEYGQETFLGLFGLYTPEVLKKLNQRHSKRKRRTVQNASGVDFHYGQQLSAMETLVLGIRTHKKSKDKPEFLLSPKEKRLQANAKRPYTRKSKSPDKITLNAGGGGGSAGNGNGSGAAIPVQPGEGGGTKYRKYRECRQCKRKAERDALFCHFCAGFFHAECHEPTKIRHQAQMQNSRCPPCLREQSEKLQRRETK
ncbi:hypothetical protein KR009_000283 [Drosophila setifemur]|nr:hypothetical protein KR009_000283 [Drosophila setifemur]